MTGGARYDAVAEWYDRELATSPLGAAARGVALRLLGSNRGTLLDVGCGGGSHSVAFRELGWRVTGIDVSREQLRFARERGVDVVEADAAALPFKAHTFDAAIAMFIHTDVEDFDLAVREVARVLRVGSPFVYVGVHPCFVGPHSRFVRAEGLPELLPGYRSRGRYTEGPAISPGGLRAKVGATHLPLDAFLHAFLDAGFVLERFEEPESEGRIYPHVVALRART